MNKFKLGLIGVWLVLSTSVLCRKYVTTQNKRTRTGDDLNCDLSPEIVEEINSHSDAVQRITDLVLRSERHRTYDLLTEFLDRFGARPAGSQVLENAIDNLEDIMTQEGLDNVHTEPVPIPVWLRGHESAYMSRPFFKKLAILGLGGSVPTPPEGITADLLVVRTFQELANIADQVPGKIVVYSYDFTSYATGFNYRNLGARVASKFGAVATLIRSATDHSLYTPHTGLQNYGNETAIPVASITTEDSDMFLRMSNRGQRITITLRLESRTGNDTVSRNLVGEIQGSRYPEQLVIVGGHTDSWDLGQGAMDDGGGVFVSWRSLAILRRLGLTPKRTLRAVLWTAEEINLKGAKHYYDTHKFEQSNISVALECDYGTFDPLGLLMKYENNETMCIVRQVLTLFENINNATKLVQATEGPDLYFWNADGVPTASLLNANARYFRYHHTEADTASVLNPNSLDLCTAFWTGVSYVIANLEHPLPRA